MRSFRQSIEAFSTDKKTEHQIYKTEVGFIVRVCVCVAAAARPPAVVEGLILFVLYKQLLLKREVCVSQGCARVHCGQISEWEVCHNFVESRMIAHHVHFMYDML